VGVSESPPELLQFEELFDRIAQDRARAVALARRYVHTQRLQPSTDHLRGASRRRAAATVDPYVWR
jgi:hypothetical protein